MESKERHALEQVNSRPEKDSQVGMVQSTLIRPVRDPVSAKLESEEAGQQMY